MCCWHVCDNSIVNKNCSLLLFYLCVVYMWTRVVVQWNIYVQCGRYICVGAYVSNVKCIPVLLIILLIALSSYKELYTDIVASYLHTSQFAHVAFYKHVCCWHIHDNNMWSRYIGCILAYL